MGYKKIIKSIYQKCNQFVKEHKKLETLSIPYIEPKSTYKKLIAITGFGHSGSGAVLDLLSEFDNITALGYHDKNGGATELNKTSIGELDFLRNHGGIFDLMSAFLVNQNNHRISDCRLKDFITLSEYNYTKGGIYNDKYMELTNNFIEKLIEYKTETPSGMDGDNAFMFNKAIKRRDYANLRTPYEFNNIKRRYRCFLKHMSCEEYLQSAKEYVTSFLKTIESKEFLLLDQFLTDFCANFDLYEKVVGDYKLIAVYRDPRDVYATGRILNVNWIPEDIELFIKWYSSRTAPYLSSTNKNFLLISFEDLILNYDTIINNIYEFLGIDSSHHIHKGEYLQVNKSIKNVGIYKTLSGYDKELSYIEDKLKDFCYNK